MASNLLSLSSYLNIIKIINQNDASATDRKLCKISLKTWTWEISIFILEGAYPTYPLVSAARGSNLAMDAPCMYLRRTFEMF